MSNQTMSTKPCEVCGNETTEKFSTFELESYDIFLDEEKDFHTLCYPCFHKLSEKPLHSAEVKKRMQENKKNLDQKIKEGLVCPECKMIKLDDNHVCPS